MSLHICSLLYTKVVLIKTYLNHPIVWFTLQCVKSHIQHNLISFILVLLSKFWAVEQAVTWITLKLDGRITFGRCLNKLSGRVYVEFLNNTKTLYLQDLIFQQDVRVHKSKNVSNFIQIDWEAVDWSANSCHLYQILNSWTLLKPQLQNS